ncbi:MAG: hypothetical protein ACRD3E_14290 [Terriglobales bacterium]
MNSFKAIAKRIFLALVATVLGVGIGTAINLMLIIVADHKSVPASKDFLIGYAQFLAATVFYAYRGWLVGFVVLVSLAEPSRWRFWLWLIVGTLIGVVFIYFIMGWPLGVGRSAGDLWFYAWAVVDAGLTTLAYLLLLRKWGRSASLRAAS